MATATILSLHTLTSPWPSNPPSNRPPTLASLLSPRPSSSSHPTSQSLVLFLSQQKNAWWSSERFQYPPPRTSSSEGIPSELVEDPKFVPLSDDDPVYGPPAILLLGFEATETEEIKKFLEDLDGEFLKIIHCTEDMLRQSVWEAMHTDQPKLEDVKIAKSLPRICFLSGLNGEEMMMFIDAFPESGLKPAVFAALVPNSADKLLLDVMEEIMGDHEMMSGKNSS